MSNIKNYTSEIPARTSIDRIEKLLIEAGATDISRRYQEGTCTGITFRMLVNQLPVFFRLPARVDSCFKIFWKKISRPSQASREKWMGQAERTAWKIVQEWVEMQLTMIRLDQAEVIQIFLPYVYNPATDQTFYEHVKSSGFKLLVNG